MDYIKEIKIENEKELEPTSEIILSSITISRKIDKVNYYQFITGFFQPLIKNNIEIKIEIKGKSNEAIQLTENSTQYKITKESAKQLGLVFTEEIENL